ncbi:ZN565 protein, partial [Alcedo cyanopectus]|nr:ZN565 protein [Ceyx cyanopectus]NXY91826.1 ZN565 protein [Ceyx cyanopectus]
AVQGAVTFEDVAVRFSLEEWVALETWQRELYWEVTMDTRDLVASLGEEVAAGRPGTELAPLPGWAGGSTGA